MGARAVEDPGGPPPVKLSRRLSQETQPKPTVVDLKKVEE
jgi:hypothetical protein